MNTFLQQRWGRGRLPLLARHLQCVTTVDPDSSRDLLFLKEGDAFSISYEDSQETLTLCVRIIKTTRRLIPCPQEAVLRGSIILPPFYRSGTLPVHDLYAQNYLRTEGDPSLTRHLIHWMYRSHKVRSIAYDRSLSSLARWARYWMHFVLLRLQIQGGRR